VREGKGGGEGKKGRKERKHSDFWGNRVFSGEAVPLLRSFGRSGQLGTEGHHGM